MLHVARHPLIEHHVAALRDVATPPAEFRRLASRLAVLLAYEATSDLSLATGTVQTPLAPTSARRLSSRIGLIPILRAGLGLVESIHELIPEAEVWHLGMYRDETTALPVEYYKKLPAAKPVDVALVLDPMLATGGSISAAIAALVRWGVPRIKVVSLIAAQPGVSAIESQFPAVEIHVAALDPELNAHKFIVPGLGDAGDRLFNTAAG